MSYIGRFAPSPTGLLHFGSLLAAIASYLEARSQHGLWLLRIEDLDPPRIQPGASAAIIQTLANYGFEWDRSIVFQSQRLAAYQEALRALAKHTYPCTCSRKQISLLATCGTYGPIYPGTCRQRRAIPGQQHAIRLRSQDRSLCFQDKLQGLYCQNIRTDLGDFIIRRADTVFAYQLAVVVDDGWQGVTQVVRGSDLLDNTPRQIYIQTLLGLPAVEYLHIPVAVNAHGQKLSKQTQAPALGTAAIVQNLCKALSFLGQSPPKATDFDSLNTFWDWAIAHWQPTAIPRQLTQREPSN